MAEEQSGFLGRWSRRKTDVLQGRAVVEPAVPVKPVLPDPSALPLKPAEEDLAEKPPQLSLDDVRLLTKDSDFKPFMAQNVGIDVRNAAMKKLFTDPHFNIMDGLDIYIDDYSKADPIPEAMLRAMNGSKFLSLFDEEEEEEEEDKSEAETQSASEPRDNANIPAKESVAHSPVDSQQIDPVSGSQTSAVQTESSTDSVTSQTRHPSSHDHSHLRLQPDHAFTGPEAGRSNQ